MPVAAACRECRATSSFGGCKDVRGCRCWSQSPALVVAESVPGILSAAVFHSAKQGQRHSSGTHFTSTVTVFHWRERVWIGAPDGRLLICHQEPGVTRCSICAMTALVKLPTEPSPPRLPCDSHTCLVRIHKQASRFIALCQILIQP